MARGKKKDDGGGTGVPLWMVTYGDLMTLLVTFFVLLLSFATIVEEDFKEALASVRSQILFLDFGPPKERIVPPVMETFPAGTPQMRRAAQRLRRAMAALALETQVSAVDETEGLRITIQAPVLFDTGRAALKPAGREVLQAILNELIAMPNPVVIEGHTDNVPIRTAQFPSNWELSTARAIAVGRFFMDDGGMQPRRVGVTGYAQYRPVATNDTAEGRERNRRVELFVYKNVTPYTETTAYTGAAAQPAAAQP